MVPKTPVTGAFLEGWRRVLKAPAMVAGLFVATFFFALPISLAVRGAADTHFGASLEARAPVPGWDAGWASEFGAIASGLGRSFSLEVLGFGATLGHVSRFMNNASLEPLITVALAAYIALWVFLSGGVLDRIARGRTLRAGVFFYACATYFPRFVRLTVAIGAAYWVLLRAVHPWMFGTLFSRWTTDVTTEREAMLLRVGLYLVFGGLLVAVNLVADFAKVRAVVEDRRSVISALQASFRFIRRRPLRTLGLYLLNILVALAIARMWLSSAPAAGVESWLALFITQIYLLFRIWAKLAFMASEVVFFQGELAHAQYTAAPEPTWPDSPSVEALRNLKRS